MENEKLFYMLALQSVTGLGIIRTKKLLNHFGGPKQILQANRDEIKEIKGLGASFLKQLSSSAIYEKAEKEMRFIEANGILAVGPDQEAYPAKLQHCPDAPLLLFSKGKFDINDRKIISIVGTRMMTSYGRKFLKEFIAEIKKFDPIIVSGLAYGTDSCAHQESLHNDICTVGVLAHGLDLMYPKAHIEIADKMLINGGLYSEFLSGSLPEKHNFVKRNRIIAGLSEATIVVESASKGGSLITAELAQSYHREVFAVPGKTTDAFSKGCNMLIKSNKAAMITCVKDLEYVLGWTSKPAKKRALQKELFIEMSEDEKRVYDYLHLSGKVILDQLALEIGFSIQKSLMLLLNLELKGLVKSYPGKIYTLN